MPGGGRGKKKEAARRKTKYKEGRKEGRGRIDGGIEVTATEEEEKT